MWDAILLAIVVGLIGGGSGLKRVDVASRKSPARKTWFRSPHLSLVDKIRLLYPVSRQ